MPEPAETSVLFPIVGCRSPEFVRVNVSTFWRPVARTLVHVGPKAQTRADDVAKIIHCARFYGPAKGTDRADLEVSLELELDPLAQGFDGDSYSLAVALADMRVAGLLPGLATGTVVATGKVDDTDEIGKVGLLEQKLALIESALTDGRFDLPLQVVIPGANLTEDASPLAQQIQRLREKGAAVHFLARLSDTAAVLGLPTDIPNPPGPSSLASPQRKSASERRHSPRLTVPLIAGAIVAGGALLAYLYIGYGRACAELPSTLAAASECWDLRPLVFAVECRFREGRGYTPWTDCPTDLALRSGDKFRLKALPEADGYLYAWEIDDRQRKLTDVLLDPSKRRVSAGETVLLPKAGGSFELDLNTTRTRFVAILTGSPIDPFERSDDTELYATAVPTLLTALGKSIALSGSARP